ncbi:ornithine cyclodeaminase family protein [Paracoccus sp. P2]|uniref:Ornithine cyclodeaminase n=1 Tax=Paracoccus pantotrophus TaxID=82367 RepID=A0A1I5IUN2_PARPN|nr:ornithine cyclodeaminase [Paracoccus pantotrophus]MDF3855191.1 ornithine cyclodeaminase [Paracoccus pantotrophus]QFG36368.1 ornithine cyclodeaminase [Paracoccus pantotrophus]QLH16951.1 ornithine cyclodeaminase [Paracoccus pantotrophus]RDD97956.1 ornithine cyclodeaminase [Paracoccus pantotrophus]RKS43049.1 ornithine cyclodeaminase [Paracoccus pantotrophus]
MTSNGSAPQFLSYEAAIGRLDWSDAVEALRQGHALPRAQIRDVFLGPPTGTMMSRSAWIEGLGYGAKTFTVFDGNAARGLPTVQGAMLVFDGETGSLQAIVDSPLVTEIKTAADSVLGASLLARPDSRHLLIVGAGTVATSLVKAYTAVLPGIERVSVWSRRPEQARELVAGMSGVKAELVAVEDLQDAVGLADIVSSATMARQPVILGDWVRPGTHVDLIGAFKADMREADDALMGKAALFVDSRETTLGHIGELMLPIASGAITEDSVLGDLYDLVRPDARRRQANDEITLFKNGGGAHLDLMIASWIARVMAG